MMALPRDTGRGVDRGDHARGGRGSDAWGLGCRRRSRVTPHLTDRSRRSSNPVVASACSVVCASMPYARRSMSSPVSREDSPRRRPRASPPRPRAAAARRARHPSRSPEAPSGRRVRPGSPARTRAPRRRTGRGATAALLRPRRTDRPHQTVGPARTARSIPTSGRPKTAVGSATRKSQASASSTRRRVPDSGDRRQRHRGDPLVHPAGVAVVREDRRRRLLASRGGRRRPRRPTAPREDDRPARAHLATVDRGTQRLLDCGRARSTSRGGSG